MEHVGLGFALGTLMTLVTWVIAPMEHYGIFGIIFYCAYGVLFALILASISLGGPALKLTISRLPHILADCRVIE